MMRLCLETRSWGVPVAMLSICYVLLLVSRCSDAIMGWLPSIAR